MTERFDVGESLMELEENGEITLEKREDIAPDDPEDIKTLIDSNANYPFILKALCDIPWEGGREEWINYLAKKRGNIDKRAIRRDIKQFFK